MLARFLNILEVEFISKKYEKISLTDWMLEHNPNILKLFTIFFRNILVKLDIEDAFDEGREIPFTVAISNLIEYFDISYRNFGEFFLVCEANYFLASVDNELIIGQYFENGKKKGNKKNSINIDQE